MLTCKAPASSADETLPEPTLRRKILPTPAAALLLVCVDSNFMASLYYTHLGKGFESLNELLQISTLQIFHTQIQVVFTLKREFKPSRERVGGSVGHGVQDVSLRHRLSLVGISAHHTLLHTWNNISNIDYLTSYFSC
jgi:hypothetical protein